MLLRADRFLIRYARFVFRGWNSPFDSSFRSRDRDRTVPRQIQDQRHLHRFHVDSVRGYPVESFRPQGGRDRDELYEGLRPDPVRVLDRPSGRPGILPLLQERRTSDEYPCGRPCPVGCGRHRGDPFHHRRGSQDYGRRDVRSRDQHPGTRCRPADDGGFNARGELSGV